MIRILIADDEHHIVNYLVELLNRADHEEWELYKAFNGLEAIRLLENIEIDIMLLDINMPGLNGLEVGKKVNNNWPNTKIIYLTAYDDFSYIYQAEKMDIEGFLLKNEEDLIIVDKILETIEKIHMENATLQMVSDAKKQEIMLHNLLYQEVMKDIRNGMEEKTIKEKIDLLGIEFPLAIQEKLYCIVNVVQHRNFYHPKEMTTEQTMLLLQYLDRQFSDSFRYVYYKIDPTNFAIFLQERDTLEQAEINNVSYLKSRLQGLIDFFKDNFHLSTHWLLYEKKISFSEMNRCLRDLIGYEDYLQKNATITESIACVVHVAEIDKDKKIEIISTSQISELQFYLQKRDKNKFLEILHIVRKCCVEHKSMHNLACIQCYNTIALMILSEISKAKLETKIATKIALYPLYYLSNFSSWEQAFSYLEQVTKILLAYLSDKVLDKNQMLVGCVKDYVREHYGDPLNLSIISNYVNYNESYISRIFKQTNGIGLNEYINQVRLEQAKKYLLQTSDSIQQIAQNTGFDTSQYFSNVFKKYYGVSPSDFRLSSKV